MARQRGIYRFGGGRMTLGFMISDWSCRERRFRSAASGVAAMR